MNKLLKETEILYEDDHLIAVNKPPRLLTLPDRFHPDKANLYRHLQDRFPSIFIIHRLDRDTSGLLLFAKTPEAHAAMSKQFEEHKVKKTYLALLQGRILPEEGTIDRPIIVHPAGDGRMTTASKGKASVSHYKVEQYFKSFSWVSVRIESGRTHQIRVHMAYLKHPLAVDPLYGGAEGVFLSSFKEHYREPRSHEEQPLIDRVPLHAAKLAFNHPITGVPLLLEAPLPKDLRAVLRQLERWSS